MLKVAYAHKCRSTRASRLREFHHQIVGAVLGADIVKDNKCIDRLRRRPEFRDQGVEIRQLSQPQPCGEPRVVLKRAVMMNRQVREEMATDNSIVVGVEPTDQRYVVSLKLRSIRKMERCFLGKWVISTCSGKRALIF